MTDGLQPYPEYKDSGFPWIGQIPSHWNVSRIKNEFWNLDYKRVPLSSSERGAMKRRDYDYYGASGVIDKVEDYLFDDELILIAEDGANLVLRNLPLVIIARGKFWVNNHAHILKPQKGSIRYLANMLETVNYVPWISGAAQPKLTQDRLMSVEIAVPPIDEQEAIAQFLNAAETRIRRYIRAKQHQIRLFNEQIKVLVLRATTRGLVDNAPVKDSGLEWLGRIPSHWEIRRNGTLFIQRNETGFPELPILEVSLRTGVRVRDFDNSKRKQVMSDRSKYKRAHKGDIAYNMMRMWQGAVGVAPVDGLISPAYIIARPLEGTNSRYYEYLFRTSVYMNEVNKYSRGIVSDRNRLYWQDFKQMWSPFPPPEEQEEIVSFLDSMIDKDTRQTIAILEDQISLIREYKARLIADVITGKVDVRGLVFEMPEAFEDDDLLDVDEDEMFEEDDVLDDVVEID